MSLPRYPEYKDSGVSWLGNVPSHWGVKKLGYEFLEPPCYGVLVPDFEVGGVPMIRIMDMQCGKVVREELTTISHDLSNQYSRTLTRSGDVLLSVVGTIGEVVHVDDHLAGVNLSRAVARLQPDETVLNRRFLGWLFQSTVFETYVDLICVGSAQRVLNMGDLSSLQVGFPPPIEQTAIAAFLDRETAKIDALIAEQEKLIALLAEKRQATISHAVTRGLNPDAPMKASGVEWLGEVPAHWVVGKIQNFARRESGHTPSRQHPEYWENCTIPWFSLADVHQIRDGRTKYVCDTKELVSELGLANSSARLLPKGTVILSRTASVGYSAIMGVDMATTQDFVNWICPGDLLPEYLLFVLRGMKAEFDRLMMGSTHQTIYMPDIAKLMMAKPPVEEQRSIVEVLDEALATQDRLTDSALRAVSLLKERRSALIAAAVTGQIDVRGALPEVA